MTALESVLGTQHIVDHCPLNYDQTTNILIMIMHWLLLVQLLYCVEHSCWTFALQNGLKQRYRVLRLLMNESCGVYSK